MSRFICINPFPQFQAIHLAQQDAYTVVTPSHLACRAISAKYQPLHHFALQQIQQQQQICASPLKAQAVFRKALQNAVQPENLLGTAKAWLSSVKALLQSGYTIQPTDHIDDCALQTRQLLTVTSEYQQALYDDGFIDSSSCTGELLTRCLRYGSCWFMDIFNLHRVSWFG
ncbi:MAG: hypothetical protein WBC73_11710 [Phormidesmis sp.]